MVPSDASTGNRMLVLPCLTAKKIDLSTKNKKKKNKKKSFFTIDSYVPMWLSTPSLLAAICLYSEGFWRSWVEALCEFSHDEQLFFKKILIFFFFFLVLKIILNELTKPTNACNARTSSPRWSKMFLMIFFYHFFFLFFLKKNFILLNLRNNIHDWFHNLFSHRWHITVFANRILESWECTRSFINNFFFFFFFC